MTLLSSENDSSDAVLRAASLATRLFFLVAGVALSSWAPLVPYAKERTGLDEAGLGLLLLCLGLGSVTAMPLAGGLASRWGSRPVILVGALGLALLLPPLGMAHHPWALGAALFGFGASLGALDVAINIHGLEVEQRVGRALMSHFHGFYSLGGLVGSALMTVLLTRGLGPAMAATTAAGVVGLCGLIAAPRLLAARPKPRVPFFVRPRGVVLLIGAIAFVIFLAEGALLDWGAVYLRETRGMAESWAGVGFVLFSCAMTVARLTGDRMVGRWGTQPVLSVSAVLAALGFAVIVVAPPMIVAVLGFAVTGVGAANLVPILFSAAGRQTAMPKDLAISAISVMGYAGILIGPAAIGWIAHYTSLPSALGVLSLAVLGVAFFGRVVSTADRP